MTHGYKQIRVGELTHASLKKAVSGGSLSIPASKMSGSRVMLVHPLNAKAYEKAKKSGRGCRLQIAHGEIHHDLQHHEANPTHGGSLWSWLKRSAKSVYKFAKNNWNVIKPVVSKVADAAVPALASAFGQPELAGVARSGLKSLTGVGVKLPKGSPEAKQHMARLRSMKKTKKASGGSFRL